jgi:O-antigen ligase
MLSPVWRNRISGTGAAVLAIAMAVEIANEQFFWPALCAVVLVAIALVHTLPYRFSTLLLGILLAGYIVGNRGFAQLSASSRFPLLPAELVLLLVGLIFLTHCAFRRELPFRRDALDFALLGWIICGTLRLPLDVKQFGFAAVRDYATVYYAAFFFLVRWAARESASRQFIWHCLLVSCGALALVFPLFTTFPSFFTSLLLVRGTPLIYFKGDLAGTFMAVGAILFFLRFEERRSWWALLLSLALIGIVVSTDNRASMLGLIVAMTILFLRGRWKFAAFQAIAGVVAVLAVLLVAQARNKPWTQTPLFGLYEKVLSVADPFGARQYSGDATYNKGDNNVWRAVWWRVCIDEAVETNPWLGLGWGYDLAQPFVRVYYPEGGDDFSTRSPHNVLVTIFARTGVIGLATFLAVLIAIGWRAWRAAKEAPLATAGMWVGLWAIITSACLGVVLEGPMGAVVFWSMLGLASAFDTAAAETLALDTTENTGAIEATPINELDAHPATP